MLRKRFGAAWQELRVVNDLRDKKKALVKIVKPMDMRIGTVNAANSRFIAFSFQVVWQVMGDG